MRVEEVKTSFIADTQKYIRDIQKAQKVLNTFLNTNDMTKKEKAENRLQVAIQKRAQAQAKALTEELKLKRQVDATNSKLASSQNNVNKSISKSSSSSKMFAGELAHMARNVMTLYYSFKSLSQVLTAGIDFNRTKEDARLAFTVMFRSADIASQKIRELQEYAVKSPLSFKETISASKQLSAYGFGAGELVPAMEMLGTVAKATGHSLDDISYVYGTLRTQGRAYSRDLMQFSMRGIPIYEELAEVLKVDQKEIKKLTEEGKVGFKEVEKAFKNMTKEGGKFGGLLDEYMKGFSGIASQLEDTFQQSMGQMTEPMFEALKTQMRELIATLDSSEMNNTFKSIGESIGSIVPMLGNFLVVLIKILPVLLAIGKAIVAFLVISKVVSVFRILPNLITIASNKVLGLVAVMGRLNIGTWDSNIKGAFMYGVQGFKALGIAAKSFALANPWLLALIGGAILAVITVKILKSSIDKARKQIEDDIINGFKDKTVLLKFDLDIDDIKQKVEGIAAYLLPIIALGGIGAGMSGIALATSKKKYMTEEEVKKVAEAYDLTVSAAASFLYEMEKIDREMLLQIGRNERLARSMEDYNNALENNKDLQIQAWLAETTGKKKDAYANTKGTPILPDGIRNSITGQKTNVYYTLGGTAAEDYISGLEQSLRDKEGHLQYTWEHLYSPDMMKDSIQSAIDEIDALLVEASQFTAMRGGKEIPWFNLTGWDEAMRKKREELLKMLGDGSGSGAKGAELKIKLDPWFDREKMASATKMIFDDLELQRDKDFATAQEKLDKQEISYAQYIRAIGAIEDKYLVDVIEAHRNTVLEVFELWENGSAKFFENFKKDFVDAATKGGDILSASKGLFGSKALEGSQIGNILSGALGQRDASIQKSRDEWIAAGNDPAKFNAGYAKQSFDMLGALKGSGVTQFITSLAEMALSVDEVNQVLNPFRTIAEGIGNFLKPLLSVGFSGIASVLKELGEVVGKILLPILMPIMMMMQQLAGILKITLIPVLQIVGSTFAWLYDKIFVPVGNAIIDLINGIIGLINKIPGIEIEKLRKFKTTVDMIAETSGNLADTMQYMINKLTSMIDKELQSLQDLYEVGAISGAELQGRADELNLKRLSLEENLVDVNIAQMENLADIYDWLVMNGAYPELEALIAAMKLGVTLPQGFYGTDTGTVAPAPTTNTTPTQWENAKMLAKKAGEVVPVVGHIVGGVAGAVADVGKAIFGGIKNFFGFASGTPYIPSDMIAQVHKGEGIVPATFMDAIRAGELTLSGASGSGNVPINNYYITIEGTVTSENNLVDVLANKIDQRRDRGYGRK